MMCFAEMSFFFLLAEGVWEGDPRFTVHVAEGARGVTAHTAIKKGKPTGSALHLVRYIGLAVASCVSKPRSIAGKHTVKSSL